MGHRLPRFNFRSLSAHRPIHNKCTRCLRLHRQPFGSRSCGYGGCYAFRQIHESFGSGQGHQVFYYLEGRTACQYSSGITWESVFVEGFYGHWWQRVRTVLFRYKPTRVEDTMEYRGDIQKPGNCATFIYTSGTTGPPKAVMISHDSYTYICANVAKATNAWRP